MSLKRRISVLIEDGDLEEADDLVTKVSLKQVRTSCGSSLFVVAPHPSIAEWLLERGVDLVDPEGDLLCNSYTSVAEWMTRRSISIQPALFKIEHLQKLSLSPTTQKGLVQRKQDLIRWKQETHHSLLYIMINDTPLIRDIAQLILQYLI